MKHLLHLLLLSTLFVVGASLTFSEQAFATGPANCPTGQTALAQKYGTAQYCALSVCKLEYKHADVTDCSAADLLNPLIHCLYVKYEARPRFPQPPSPTGSWGNQPACPANLNTANWY